MRCKNCRYPLWNLKARTCPECGQTFAPSEFRFTLNSVQFCCTACGQAYYGTDEQGHLDPASFACVRCGSAQRMDDMVLLPAPGVEERSTRGDTNPWVERDGRRVLGAWVRTVFRGIGAPGRLLLATPVADSSGPAWRFALLNLAMGMGLNLLALLLFFAALSFGGGGGGVAVGAALAAVLVAVVGGAVFLACWIGTAHLVLRLTGSVAHGIGRTSQALCYTSGPILATAVPCLGIYVGWIGTIWWAIAGSIAIATAQQVRGWRAALAACLFPVAVVATIVGLYAWVVAGAISGARTAMQTAGTGGTTEAMMISRTLRARLTAETLPRHGAEMIADGTIPPWNVVVDGVWPAESTTIGESTLDEFINADDKSRAMLAQSLAASMPDGVVAHRVGSVVFTYHGLTSDADARLWTAVVARERSAGVPLDPVIACLADGSTALVYLHELPAKLEEQNALRDLAGLPPLPDPRDVGDAIPAVGGGP